MYISTRNNFEKVTAARAIKLGMVPSGGLFVPERIPVLPWENLKSLKDASYQEVAQQILALYLEDYSIREIRDSIQGAYSKDNFYHSQIAPLHELDEQTYVLELWHGPTAAFKDMALQIMPRLLALALEKIKTEGETVILVATSGDTGKAALEGFKDVPGIRIIVFYPYGGVSKVQEMQMTTTEGDNTHVVAVRGNFDDCQNAVKEIFGDKDFKAVLLKKGFELSSANSINWGRLLPQIVYYVYSYVKLLGEGKIKDQEKVNYVVPTGNFGNILAGWYARKMGVPINKLICASNENKVLTDFFSTGVYDRNRLFKHTNSPSMDILVSSNLERFLFEITEHDGEKINLWMNELADKGRFEIDNDTHARIKDILVAGFAHEEETLATIHRVFAQQDYILDTHTAVGMKVYEQYLSQTKDSTKTVIDATASPFKFNTSVLKAIAGEGVLQGKDEFDILKELSQITKQPIHPALSQLDQKPVLHERICDKEDIKQEIMEILFSNEH